MGVQLNIKDPETVRLARELARRLGQSVTATIRQALEQVDAPRDSEARARAAALLAEVRRLPFDPPACTAGRSSRHITRQFHEQEWQEQYGPDRWS